MLSAIAEYITQRRRELGRHVLYLGGKVRTSPDESRVIDVLYEMGSDWARDRQIELPEEQAGPAALEALAEQVGDHAERCQLLQKRLESVRPSEGHTRLARMIADGYFPAVFTADPTDMLQQALHNHHMEPEKDYHLLVAGVDEPNEIELALASSTRVVVVKCAGSLTKEFLPLATSEVSEAINSIGPVISHAFKTLSLFVAHAEREREFIKWIPREGDRVFWINRVIPMDDRDLYQELKLESPESVDYHMLQPDVMNMLRSRASARHLICREPGEASAFFSALEDRLTKHRRSSGRQRKSGPALSVLTGGPYRFLDHYTTEDAEIFYGRDQDTNAVVEMIREHQLSVLFGPSGRGKTSLLMAGVIPALLDETQDDDKPDWLPALLRCGEDPTEATIEATNAALGEMGATEVERDVELRQFLSNVIEQSQRTVVLMIDQFEEFFVRIGDRLREKFMEQLSRALQLNPDSLRVILSIREDYLGELFDLREWLPTIAYNAYRLHKLAPMQAKLAAIKPGSRFHVKVEEELVDRVLEDIAGEDGVEPTELQIVMDRLYQAMPMGTHVLGAHAYDQLSGADRILERYLEHALNELSGSERRAARNVLKNMVASSELKAVRSVARIAAETDLSYDQVEKLLARLDDLRLVRRVGKPEKHEYEVVHEYVADKIEEWMSQGEVEVKDVQDLLTREISNYEKFGLLMQPGALRIMYQHRDELTISPEEMELVVRSAVERAQNADYWLGRAGEMEERLEPTLRELLLHDEVEVRLSVLRALKPYLSKELVPALVKLLDDYDQQIRKIAEEHLRWLDRELIEMLGKGSEEQRRLAAYALGRIESRRALRPLADALDDSDEDLRDHVAEALMEMDSAATTRLLLRRLREHKDAAPWAVAYALGRVAQEPKAAAEIENARNGQPPSAQLAFALAMTYAHQREWDAALTQLAEAERLAKTPVGEKAIEQLRRDIAAERERVIRQRRWPMFHADLQRTGATDEVVAPPLQEEWSFRTRGPVVASPAIADGLVCVGSRDSYLYGLNSATGALRWELQTGDRVETTPCITNQFALVTSGDGSLYAVSLRDGTQHWALDTGAPSRSSPAACEGLVYAGNQEGRLVAVDVNNGRIKWEMRAGDEISAAPMLTGGLVVTGSWDSILYALDAGTGEEVWRMAAEAPIVSSASAIDDRVYVGSDAGTVMCMDAGTGKIIWNQQVEGRVRSCPALASGLVIVGSMDGNIYALRQDSGELVWTTDTDEEVLASAVVSGDTVYIGSKDGSLYGLALATGENIWTRNTSYAIYSSPAVADQMLVLGMNYYDVVAFSDASTETNK